MKNKCFLELIGAGLNLL